MGIDENTENWNKENFTTTLKKKVNFQSSAGAQKFEPLPKQFSFKLVATCSQSELLSENPDDPWTKFKKKL
uniref:Uncharacterized protein n=1 Tax=Panagrolaimus davidi TaxID=227884 RepID=A0A914P086_9BILA